MNDYCRACLHFPFVDTDIPNFVASMVTARFYIYLRTMNTACDLSIFLLSLFILLHLPFCLFISTCNHDVLKADPLHILSLWIEYELV